MNARLRVPVRIVATYIGGPLDGQTATRRGTRWSAYRDDSGQPIAASRGDCEFVVRPLRGEERRRFYVCQSGSAIIENPGGEKEIVKRIDYVHATAWDSYRNQNG